MPYFKYSRPILMNCFVRMFERLSLVSKFGIDMAKLKKFILEICRNYRRVPFHNMTHAFNVTHMLYMILSQNERNGQNYFAKEVFEDLDKLSMLLACIGHDLNHPGVGNTYFVKANNMMSQSVNGKSVLEHYHCYNLIRIIEQTDLLSNLTYKQY